MEVFKSKKHSIWNVDVSPAPLEAENQTRKQELHNTIHELVLWTPSSHLYPMLRQASSKFGPDYILFKGRKEDSVKVNLKI